MSTPVCDTDAGIPTRVWRKGISGSGHRQIGDGVRFSPQYLRKGVIRGGEIGGDGGCA